ncbi:MAG: Rnf-Nqr domain containing protein [Gammaproteobacteria bacterium]
MLSHEAHSRSWHPLGAGLLGVCPLLARSTSLLSGLTMSVALVVTVMLSVLTVGLCRRFIPVQARFVYLLLITTTWVTVGQLLMGTWLYSMGEFLGIYVSLLAVNCLVLARLEEDAMAKGAVDAVSDAFAVTVRLALFVIATGTVRELAASGALLADLSLLVPGADAGETTGPIRLSVFATPAGAFLTFALLAAGWNRVSAMVRRGTAK